MKICQWLPLVRGSAGSILCQHQTLVFHHESSVLGLSLALASLQPDTQSICFSFTKLFQYDDESALKSAEFPEANFGPHLPTYCTPLVAFL